MNGRRTGIVCGVCGDVIREVKWVQPCLEKGMGDSVAFIERGCLCGWVPVGVDEIPADKMRNIEKAYDIEAIFHGRPPS